MRRLRFFIALYCVSLFAMACGPAGDTGLPPVGSQPEDGRTIDPNTGLPPSRGGEISLPKLPDHSFPTTSNGYLTLLRVDSYVVASTYDLIGAAENTSGLYLLLERSSGSSIKMWDIYKIESDSPPFRVCSLVRPGSTNDRYRGFIAKGSGFRIFGENSGDPSWARIYTFSISTCALESYKSISSGAVYTITPIFANYGTKFFYAAGSQIKTWDESTGLVLTWSYSSASISGVTPYPLQLTYSVFNDGSIWFLDNNRRIWLGNQLGQWLGFAEFPYGVYPDLSYSKFIVQSSSGLKIVCFNKYGETLIVYGADASHFLRP